jgi:hypothetical protein
MANIFPQFVGFAASNCFPPHRALNQATIHNSENTSRRKDIKSTINVSIITGLTGWQQNFRDTSMENRGQPARN